MCRTLGKSNALYTAWYTVRRYGKCVCKCVKSLTTRLSISRGTTKVRIDHLLTDVDKPIQSTQSTDIIEHENQTAQSTIVVVVQEGASSSSCV